jgi:hypothetical protein
MDSSSIDRLNTNRNSTSGQFGAQTFSDSQIRLTSMETSVLNPPYPSAPFTEGEVAQEQYGDGVTCTCGNDTGEEGFSSADRTGRLASLTLERTPAGLGDLPEEDALAVCNTCGRIFDDAHNYDDASPVLGRIDTTSDEWNTGRALYVKHNFGEDS